MTVDFPAGRSGHRPILIVHDIRSAYNVGAILRTADAIGGATVICCGITPHPRVAGDTRSPVVVDSNTRAIAKTALGAEQAMPIEYERSVTDAVARARAAGATVLALEQDESAGGLFEFEADPRTAYALLIGSEVDGIGGELLALADHVLELPQRGAKESLNVSVAAGIALYHLFGNFQ